ncbi:MAG: diaminopimelate decarboxylase, partial [Planctomycetota bacterium]|nr:diaminopimelate decarboxylase [Planctomycetota bacterium]
MDYFEYRKGELWCEGVRVARLAREYGTPLYVYSARTITEHFRRIREAFTRPAPRPGPASEPFICYSVKANSNLAVLKLLRQEGAGFDVVSGGELHRVLKIGADPKRIVFAGVGKTDAEIAAGLDAGILMFNVESEAELDNIDRIARKRKMTAPVALRLNPDVDPKTHKYITTGKHENKFGIDLVTAGRIVEGWTCRRNVRLVGLHVHVGSQLLSVKPYVAAMKKVAGFVRRHEKALGLSPSCGAPGRSTGRGAGGATGGIAIDWINIGGGFGVFYREREALPAKEFADAVLPLAAKIAPRIVLEPGRFIVGNAGILVTKVLYTKDSGDKVFVVCDSGMNDLIRPSLYGAFHRVWPLRFRAERHLGAAGRTGVPHPDPLPEGEGTAGRT